MVVARALVVGSGAVGLRTALELSRRNVAVVLQAPRPPLHASTCSVVAGGLWMPILSHDPRTSRWAIETLDELLPMANEDNDLVEVVPTISLKVEHSGPKVEDFEKGAGKGVTRVDDVFPDWSKDPRLDFQHMSVEMLAWQNVVYRLRIPPQKELLEAGYNHAWMFRPPIVNSPKMLGYMLEQVRQEADQVDVETGHYFESMEEMCQVARDFNCDAVVNCAGLGSSAIRGADDASNAKMVPIRGVTMQLDRTQTVRRPQVLSSTYDDGENVNDAVLIADEGPWATDTMPSYLIPRGDQLILGGTFLEGDNETEIREAERAQLVLNGRRWGVEVPDDAKVAVGFRPYRSMVRCEIDRHLSSADLQVAHNYGHGGSGWTINVGTAKECVDLLF